MNKQIRGKGMMAMPSKKQKQSRKETKQKHKKQFREEWDEFFPKKNGQISRNRIISP